MQKFLHSKKNSCIFALLITKTKNDMEIISKQIEDLRKSMNGKQFDQTEKA